MSATLPTADEIRAIVREEIARALSSSVPSEREVFDVAGAAEFLGVHPDTLRRMAKAGKVPAGRIGTDWRFRRGDLLAMLDARPSAKLVAIKGGR